MNQEMIDATMQETLTALESLYAKFLDRRTVASWSLAESLDQSLTVARQSLDLLEGPLMLAVMGQHPFPLDERQYDPVTAWRVWQELAEETGTSLHHGLGLSQKWSIPEVGARIVKAAGENLFSWTKWAAIAGGVLLAGYVFLPLLPRRRYS